MCRYCDVRLYGSSTVCVSCYRKHWVECYECMVHTKHGWTVRKPYMDDDDKPMAYIVCDNKRGWLRPVSEVRGG